MTGPVLRFAPSPNGRLHLGHAYSALLNDAVARRLGGTWLLRIEDIDPARCRPAFEAAIYEDLRWLGLAWPEPVRRQSEHMAEYGAGAEVLRSRRLLYPCVCSRREIATAVADREAELGQPWPRDPDGAPLYPGTCRSAPSHAVGGRLADDRALAWRLDMEAARAAVPGPLSWTAFDVGQGKRIVAADPRRWGDAVLVRKDTPTSYHLAVVLDDAAQLVTHVVRGADLEPATDLHVLLQRLLGLTTPHYHHHALIRNDAGEKLSKRFGSPALADIRAGGAGPGDVRTALDLG